MEAVTQMHEVSATGTPIEGYVLRDISIKNALVTPDDDTGIEVLLTMRPSLHGEGEAQNAWWDFNVATVPTNFDQRRRLCIVSLEAGG